MDERLQGIFDSVPKDPPRSRLEPYRELILLWRRQGRSYRHIRQLLHEKCQVKVADMTLHEFVQRRSRPRKVQPGPELQIGVTLGSAEGPRQTISQSDQYAAARERMRRHKEQSPMPTLVKRFEYTEKDSIDPIVLLPKTEKEK